MELSAEDVGLYESIDGHKTVAQLEGPYPGARDRLLAWHEAELLELILPITPVAKPHIVVVEPHMDDAALSVGGRLLNRRGRSRITILSVMKWSSFTSYLTVGRDFANVEEITDLRIRESELAAKILGAEQRSLEWKDAVLRSWPSERWSAAIAARYKREGFLFTVFVPDSKEVSQLANQLAVHLADLDPDELWIPMGTSNHGDHRCTRNACLLMLAENRQRFSDFPVLMYEDLPYAAVEGQAQHIRTVLSEHGARLTRYSEDVTEVFDEKLRAISAYASQFKIAFMEPKIRRIAERDGGGGGKLVEVYHRLEGEFSLPPEPLLSREAAGLMRLRSGLRSLKTGGGNRRRITVMALPSGSVIGWEKHTRSLEATFPAAHVRLFMPEDMAWQMEDSNKSEKERLRVGLVRPGIRGWLGVLWTEVFHLGTPTIVLWRGAYGAQPHRAAKKLVNTLIRLLLPFRRMLFARSLRDLTQMQEGDPRATKARASGVAPTNSKSLRRPLE
jgi:LmbE family N-acetylglucosaminyl deacetylase